MFVPTWNESQNIDRLVRELMTVHPEIHVVIIDDLSPDGTGDIAEALKAEFPRLHVVHRQGPRGRGWAGIAGYIWGLDHGAKFIVEMDADFSHRPRDLPKIIDALQDADAVLGSRYIKGGKDLRSSTTRRIISRIANIYQKIMFRTHVRDCTSGYRGYRAEVLETIGVRSLDRWGPAVLSDILYRIIREGYRIVEVPIEFPDREQGESNLSFKILWEGLLNVARLTFRVKR